MGKRYETLVFDAKYLWDDCEGDELLYQDLFDHDWDNFTHELSNMFTRKFKEHSAFKINSRNLDWYGSSGYSYVDGGDMLCVVNHLFDELSRSWSTDFIKVKSIDKGFIITMYSHDCPTGAFFEIKKCAQSTVDKWAGRY